MSKPFKIALLVLALPFSIFLYAVFGSGVDELYCLVKPDQELIVQKASSCYSKGSRKSRVTRQFIETMPSSSGTALKDETGCYYSDNDPVRVLHRNGLNGNQYNVFCPVKFKSQINYLAHNYVVIVATIVCAIFLFGKNKMRLPKI